MQVGTRFIVNRLPEAYTEYLDPCVTIGKEYVIAGLDEDNEPYFIDDSNRANFCVGHDDGMLEPNDGYYTIL